VKDAIVKCLRVIITCLPVPIANYMIDIVFNFFQVDI